MNYISKQFAGPIVQGFSNAVESFFNTKFMPTINYFKSLSIDSANEKHTETIGKLIGFPRPLIQKELLDATLFKFTVSYYHDVDIGFALTYGSAGTTVGGALSTPESASVTAYMDLSTYKSILKILAKSKYSNKRRSLRLIDSICHEIAQDKTYTIEWTDSNSNILITFTDLKAYSVYVVGYILNALFDTMPSIVVTKETV